MADILAPLLVSVPLSLTTFTYIRSLTPIYGSVPTSYHLHEALFALLFLVSVAFTHEYVEIPYRYRALGAAAALAITPYTTYWIGVLSGRYCSAAIGTAITHLLAFLPPAASLISLGSGISETGDVVLELLLPLLSFLSSTWLETQYAGLDRLHKISDRDIFTSLSFLTALLAVLSPLPSEDVAVSTPTTSTPAPKSKSKKRSKKQAAKGPKQTGNIATWRYAILASLPIVYYLPYRYIPPPTLPHPLLAPYTHPTYPLRILSSVQSTTGLIVVGQALPRKDVTGPPQGGHMHSVRYLRADHSLIGGLWTNDLVHEIVSPGNEGYLPSLKDADGNSLGDSIYGVFVMQEAARLALPDPQRALVIGLGAGISASGLIRHGIPTTVVEIDPAVYNAARQYFGLPDPILGYGKSGVGKGGGVALQDARQWVSSAARNGTSQKYDIVIHDCFSGGGVPQHLYTLEFWNDLKKIVNPESGVVVVNFVGRIISRPSKMLLLTLEHAFCNGKKCCRGFHDSMNDDKPLSQLKYETEFLNILFFCPTSGTDPLTFRPSTAADYLNSPLRRHALGKLETYEVPLDAIRDWNTGVGEFFDDSYLLTDRDNLLGAMQEGEAHFHWGLMRKVLANVFWETY